MDWWHQVRNCWEIFCFITFYENVHKSHETKTKIYKELKTHTHQRGTVNRNKHINSPYVSNGKMMCVHFNIIANWMELVSLNDTPTTPKTRAPFRRKKKMTSNFCRRNTKRKWTSPCFKLHQISDNKVLAFVVMERIACQNLQRTHFHFASN